MTMAFAPILWTPQASADNTGVPDLTTLAGIEIPNPVSGAIVYVNDTGGGPSTGDFYYLSLANGAAVSLPNVVNTSLGTTARWIKSNITSNSASPSALTYLSQPNWFIDPINGNDANAGFPSSAPIKTLAELQRRWGINGTLNPTGGICTVMIVNSLPSTDPLTRIPNVLGGKILAFQGTPVQQSTGNITTATAPAGNASWILNAAFSGGIAANLERRLRITSGGNAGNIVWIKKDLGASNARVTEPANSFVPPVSNAGGFPTLGVIANGDAYAIETLPNITLACETANVDTNSLIVFTDLTVASRGGFGCSGAVFFYDCLFNTGFTPTAFPVAPALSVLCNCNAKTSGGNLGGVVAGPGSQIQVFAGGSTSAHEVLAYGVSGGLLLVDMRAVAQDGGMGVVAGQGGALLFGTARTYDATNHAINNPDGSGLVVDPSGTVVVKQVDDTSTFIKGSGHSGHGAFIASGGMLAMSATAQGNTTVTGTAGDFDLNAGTATVKSIDYTSNALTVAIAQTWANLVAALPAGFGGTAVNIATNARIVSQAAAHP